MTTQPSKAIRMEAEPIDTRIDKKIEFLYASIEDARDTIRAIDQKVNFLFVGLAIPLSGFGKIVSALKVFYLFDPLNIGQNHLFSSVVTVVFIFTWACSFYLTLKVLASPENPTRHIINDSGAKGVFFCANLFTIRFVDIFRIRKGLRANSTLANHIKQLNLSQNRLIEELAFEQMKLVYLRELKRKRQIAAYRSFFAWVILGGCIWCAILLH